MNTVKNYCLIFLFFSCFSIHGMEKYNRRRLGNSESHHSSTRENRHEPSQKESALAKAKNREIESNVSAQMEQCLFCVLFCIGCSAIIKDF